MIYVDRLGDGGGVAGLGAGIGTERSVCAEQLHRRLGTLLIIAESEGLNEAGAAKRNQ